MARASGSCVALSGTQRVFFALWPGAQVRASLAQAGRHMHDALHGRLTRADSIHLTLAFLGDVDNEVMPRLLDPPSGIAPEPFDLTLDEWGCWTHNNIGWVAPSRVPAPLGELAANLAGWLRGAGLSLEQRPFKPHVTLVRKAHCARMEQAMLPIAWQVSDFVLVRSQRLPQQSRYEVLGSWPLRARE